MKHNSSGYPDPSEDPLNGMRPQPDAKPPAHDEPPRRTRKQDTRWNTSDEAYAAVPRGAGIPILAYIKGQPSTCDEVQVALNSPHQSCSAAINKLMRDGLVVANGSRLTRLNRRAKVWEATNADAK